LAVSGPPWLYAFVWLFLFISPALERLSPGVLGALCDMQCPIMVLWYGCSSSMADLHGGFKESKFKVTFSECSLLTMVHILSSLILCGQPCMELYSHVAAADSSTYM